MNKLQTTVKGAKTVIVRNAPQILMGIGIAGMISTTVLAVQATPKALRLIQEKKDILEKDKLTFSETIQATWKCYLPSVCLAGASVACLIGSNNISVKRSAALATAYQLVDTARREYKDKVVEVLGEKKEQSIRDELAKDKIKDNPVAKATVVVTERGNTLCYDSLSGRYFRTDYNAIEKAINKLNREMNINMYVSLNDFYDEIGLERVKIGENLGWNIDHGLIEFYPSSQLSDSGEPCLVIDFSVAPNYKYYKFG